MPVAARAMTFFAPNSLSKDVVCREFWKSSPMFSKMWKKNMEHTPTMTSLPKRSGVLCAMYKRRSSSSRYKPISTDAPTKPKASAVAEKIESVCWSGT